MPDVIAPKDAAGASNLPVSPVPAYAHRLRGIPPELRPAASRLGPLFLIFGVILPVGTLLFELITHACAGFYVDPIPTWWHFALVALVPATNLFAWFRLRSNTWRPDAWLPTLAAASIAISAIYAVIFLPLSPFAVFGVAFYGFGLVPLTPIIAFFAAVVAWSRLPEENGQHRVLPGLAAGFLSLGIPFAWDMGTLALLDRAEKAASPAEQTAAIKNLRRFGHWSYALKCCYNRTEGPLQFFAGRRDSDETLLARRDIYYRVTGFPFNSRPTPIGVSVGSRGWEVMNFDAHLGGEQVASKVAGLTHETSQLESRIDARGLTSYTEWTLVFKNIAANSSEARAQIELPPGGVVSRLTLWINGEPREAAFGSRDQVRKAYQEIAVVQRRDPVLVTTSGPDRVLMQCFPVPANGGEMKVRVGITAPLRLIDREHAGFTLPRFLETNFESGKTLAHAVNLHSNASFIDGTRERKSTFEDAQLAQADEVLISIPLGAHDSVTPHPTDPAASIRQTIQSVRTERPARVIYVIDGSRELRAHRSDLAAEFARAGEEPHAAFLAGDALETWTKSQPFAPWINGRSFGGGCDNLPALEAAWNLASAEPGSAIVWIHGPQPVTLHDIDPLLDRIAKSTHRPAIYELSVGAGPNRIIEKLDGAVRWERPLAGGASPAERVAALLRTWAGKQENFAVLRERINRKAAASSDPVADRHVARLWGREEIERMRHLPDSTRDAVKLALQLQLVTPISGAVVLETKEQYDRNDLEPVDPHSVPVVPEPASTALLATGLCWLATRRFRPRARKPKSA